jgi:kynurenine formamidase
MNVSSQGVASAAGTVAKLKKSGVELYDLSHPWGHGIPEWPSTTNLATRTLKFHAKDGQLVRAWEGIMHRSTHMDVEIHVTENGKTMADYPLSCFFGTGVAVSIPKGKWGVVTPDDLERATPTIRPGDIVMINTGSHHNLGDNDAYYQYSPGLYKEAGEWLVERGVKLVGIDVQALDHPLGTKLVGHGPGPTHPHLYNEYRAETGREIMDDFPHWEPCHKIITKAGIPGIENVGGQLDAITGKRCTFMCFPWHWPEADGCVIRVVAMLDPGQKFRFETGLG